ncbi:MAG: hypothetical protein HY741_02270 [Chloroflexi bacterium]|nr:hypothetical protein [Chloroflexota bacterium]
MFRRRGSPHPPEIRERARELRWAGLSYSEIIKELGDSVPFTTLQSWVSDIQLTPTQQQEIGFRQSPHPPETRERARELRRAGLTYPEIVAELGHEVAQGTLSGWLSDIELTTEQKARIKQKEVEGSAKGRPFAVLWNRKQKENRLQEAREQASPHAKRLAQDREALQLMAAALYIGEGAKAGDHFAFCNSDTQVIRTWMALLRRNFDIDEEKFRCQLTISSGMDEQGLKQFWSDVTGIPLNKFIRSTIDKRESKKPRDGYKGVCVVYYHSLAIRRYLDALAQGVIDEILEDDSGEI